MEGSERTRFGTILRIRVQVNILEEYILKSVRGRIQEVLFVAEIEELCSSQLRKSLLHTRLHFPKKLENILLSIVTKLLLLVFVMLFILYLLHFFIFRKDNVFFW